MTQRPVSLFRDRKVKVKVTRLLNVVTENQPYLWNRKAYELQI